MTLCRTEGNYNLPGNFPSDAGKLKLVDRPAAGKLKLIDCWAAGKLKLVDRPAAAGKLKSDDCPSSVSGKTVQWINIII